jgi:hypothetical protein
MTDFERVKLYYDKGWATKVQIGRYVYFNVISTEEYELITGDVYVV